MSCQRLLVEQGLVPQHCSNLELIMRPNAPMILRYEVFVASEHLDKLALVFQAMASEGKERQDV